MGEQYWTNLQIKGFPRDALVFEETRRGDRVISRELVGLDAEAFEAHAYTSASEEPTGEEEARAELLRNVMTEMGYAGLDRLDNKYEGENVEWEPGPAPEGQLAETGTLSIGGEQNYGTEALLALRSALRKAGFPYSISDDAGQIGAEYEWGIGDEEERRYESAEGRVLTEARWISILNESGSLKEAAGQVGDYFGLPRLGESDVESALAEEGSPGLSLSGAELRRANEIQGGAE